MQRINYATGSVVTGDALAHAIAEYAKALAKRGDSDTIGFPVLLDSGDVASAEVLVGPSSQVMNVPELTDHDEVEDDGLLKELERKTGALGVPRPQPEAAPDDHGLSFFF